MSLKYLESEIKKRESFQSEPDQKEYLIVIGIFLMTTFLLYQAKPVILQDKNKNICYIRLLIASLSITLAFYMYLFKY